jgi:hypothetical protein
MKKLACLLLAPLTVAADRPAIFASIDYIDCALVTSRTRQASPQQPGLAVQLEKQEARLIKLAVRERMRTGAPSQAASISTRTAMLDRSIYLQNNPVAFSLIESGCRSKGLLLNG